ncbi:NTF2-like N-terminal transpeptidase domain-containing protein [Thiomicrorhabdus sp. 6S3-12]|uniref:NTF2-like N-terminal transpeptidase domain-containing protein n=1 Tax=Thiomicrorhabdus sp. 6S3-12 TaxID=2819681 RepID=UPI001AAD2378|nr:NTF2-like N-terminal transpeptidase domain-containing protein [Thiomicrorhabdus sp. 6S3-12]MBO1923060.1 hypothetical protein [Thiomicrorhabdus sp. 6S3-12]
MKITTWLLLLSSFFATQSLASDTDDKQQQIEIGKLYYQNLFDNQPGKSYELLSSKDKESFSKEQFTRVIALKTSVLDKNRVVTIKGASITESDESMAVVQVTAELSTPGSMEVKTVKATQLLLKENNEWKVYSAHAIASILMQAKYACDKDTTIAQQLKEEACNLYYGTKTPNEGQK